jgi:hypothetical protein
VQTPLVWFLSQNTPSKTSGQVGHSARALKAAKNSMAAIRSIGNNIMSVKSWRGERCYESEMRRSVVIIYQNLFSSGAPAMMVISHPEAAGIDNARRRSKPRSTGKM